MRYCVALLLVLAALQARDLPARPAHSALPYQSILKRNVFGLTPRPISPEPQTNPPPSKIILTGLTTILGDPRVLLKVPAWPGSPGAPRTPAQFYILRKGQREGGIQILDVDMANLSVTLNQAGTLQTLSLDRTVPGLAAAAGPPPPPAVLPAPYWFASRS